MNRQSLASMLGIALLLTCFSPGLLWAQMLSNAGFAYPANTAKIHYQFVAEGSGTFTATLYVVNVGDLVPAGYEVASITLQGQPEEILNYTYTAPADGWPAGIYRIVVSHNARPIVESDFHIFEPD